jgi:argininosuccinate lyase
MFFDARTAGVGAVLIVFVIFLRNGKIVSPNFKGSPPYRSPDEMKKRITSDLPSSESVQGRLNSYSKAGSAPELVQSANLLEISYGPILNKGLSLADLAHTVTLAEAGIIPAEAAQELLAALLTFHKTPVENFLFDPELGDAYKNREHHIIKLAPASGGWLRTGRARREATNIAYQISVRERLLELVESLTDLADALTILAEKHTNTIMPDFTYMQHAQPTTLAHYLLSFVFPMLRDLERLQACFERVNMCPGGIGSVNGSRLPFKRQRLAELLGFDAAIMHTRDAMWQADMPVEIMSCVVTAITNIDRLGEDLQVWATQEFNLVELADGYCRESVIMPQKKNPYSLAFLRGVAGVLVGQLTAMANVGRTMSGQPDNRIFAYGDVPKALDLSINAVRLMTGVMQTLFINVPLMARRAAEGYSQATDLAEMIMLETNLPYLTSHRLVGEIVSIARERGIPAVRISKRMIDAAARHMLGHTLKLSPDGIRRALQPEEIVATRIGLGGAALEPVKSMIAEARTAIAMTRSWEKKTGNDLAVAEAHLLSLAQEMSGTQSEGS